MVGKLLLIHFQHKLYSMLIKRSPCGIWFCLMNSALVTPKVHVQCSGAEPTAPGPGQFTFAMLKLSLKSRTSNNNLLMVCVGWIPKWMETALKCDEFQHRSPATVHFDGPKWICLEIRPKTIAIPIENWRIWDDLGLHHLKEIPISRCGRQLGSCRTYWISTTWRWSWRTAKVVRLVRPWTGKITACFNPGMMPGENSELHKVWKDLNKNSWDCLNLIQTYSRISPIGCMKTY